MVKHSPDYASRVFENLEYRILHEIGAPYLARIKKINKEDKPISADLQPLAKPDGKKDALVGKAHFIINPIHYQKIHWDHWDGYTPDHTVEPIYDGQDYEPKLKYKEGDIVIAIVLQYDDDNFKGKEEFNTTTDRVHDASASYIIGKLANKEDFIF